MLTKPDLNDLDDMLLQIKKPLAIRPGVLSSGGNASARCKAAFFKPIMQAGRDNQNFFHIF
jgi:hypothetical protein